MKQELKAKDLRIGNYVIFNTNDTPFQITPVGLLELSQIENSLTPYFYEPILLTEDWLIKFGFKKLTAGEGSENYVEYYEISNLVVCNWGDGFIMSNSFSHGIRVDLKYVHQLQNLYFAITAKELELLPVESE